MRPDPLTRLRERRLLARALSVAAHALSEWPIEDTTTADAMRDLLHRDFSDLAAAFPPHDEVWDEALQRQIGEDVDKVPPIRVTAPDPAPISVPHQPYRVPVDEEADAPPF